MNKKGGNMKLVQRDNGIAWEVDNLDELHRERPCNTCQKVRNCEVFRHNMRENNRSQQELLIVRCAWYKYGGVNEPE